MIILLACYKSSGRRTDEIKQYNVAEEIAQFFLTQSQFYLFFFFRVDAVGFTFHSDIEALCGGAIFFVYI